MRNALNFMNKISATENIMNLHFFHSLFLSGPGHPRISLGPGLDDPADLRVGIIPYWRMRTIANNISLQTAEKVKHACTE